MRADHLTYRRAVTTSLLGLIGQIAIAVLLLVYSRQAGGSHAATTAAIAVAVGGLVWFALILLFDQHRRERLEAMESESLAAAESAAASAFEGSGEEIRVAARRLRIFRKFVIPGIGLVVAALLIGLGILRYHTAGGNDFAPPAHQGWGVAIGLAIAFVGFVFARYVAGMAKEHVWSPLRAGGAQAVGAALLGLAIAIAFFVDLAGGPDTLIRVLEQIIPIAMVIGGVEIAINFVLDLYRPRAPGEPDRPAFDSRILGFVAAPDKIAQSMGEALSYQLGVDVTGSWLYQLLSRSVAAFLLVAAVIAWLLSSLVVIQPHQRALVLTFGEVSSPVLSFGDVAREDDGSAGDIGPGLHVKWPWPISTVSLSQHVVEGDQGRVSFQATTTGIRVVHLGSNPPDQNNKPILWGKQHAAEEIYHIVQPSAARAGEAEVSTTGVALVAIEVPLHYRVSNVQRYEQLSAPGQQQRVLTAIGRRVVSRFFAHLTVDDVLAADPDDLAIALRTEVESAFSELNQGEGPGIEILFVGVNGVHPPRDVAGRFEGVVQALQERETAIELARASQISRLAEVAGDVALAEQIAERIDVLETRRSALREAESGGEGDAAELARQVAELELEVQELVRLAGGQAGAELARAATDRWVEHLGARARFETLRGQAAAYEAAPGLYRRKMYNQALLDMMSRARVFITTPDVPLRSVLELEDGRASLSDFNPNAGAEQ